jgi:hypothetical protein
MKENCPENEENVNASITAEEVRGIDINQVDSMQLKDGTIVVIQNEEDQIQDQENYNQFTEEAQDQAYDQCTCTLEENQIDQSNQLRARPMMGRYGPPIMAPRVMPGVPVVPRRVVPLMPGMPKPMVVPRGHMMPVGRPVFRARPGMQYGGGFGRQQGPQMGGYGRQPAGFGPQFGPQKGGFGKQQGFGPQFGPQQGGFGPQKGGYGKTQGFGPQFGPQQGGFGQQFGPQKGGFGPKQGFGPQFGPQQVGYGKQQTGFGPQFGPQYGNQGKPQGGFGPQSNQGKPQTGFGPQFGPQQGNQGKPSFNPQQVPPTQKPASQGQPQGGLSPQQTPQAPISGQNTQTNKIPVNQPGNAAIPGTNNNNRPLMDMIQYGGVYRARPNTEEQEGDYQEECVGEELCQCEQDLEGTEEQLRARPMPRVMPPYPAKMHPYGFGPVKPRPVLPVMPIGVPRRGPMAGYSTFQPRVFRARPRVGVVMAPKPMFTPVMNTFQPRAYGGYGFGVRSARPTSYHHYGQKAFMGPGPIFRNRPRSNSYDDAEENAEQYYEDELNAEGGECNKSCICTKCGKEF